MRVCVVRLFLLREIQKFIATTGRPQRRARDNLSSDTHTQTHKRGIKKEEEEEITSSW